MVYNSIEWYFAVLIIAAYVFTGHGVTDTFILNLFFYIIITSILTVTLINSYAGESQMIVEDALNRMDEILNVKTLPEAEVTKQPKDAAVSVQNVTFAYDGAKRNAIDGISLQAKVGEHIALVGDFRRRKNNTCL
ncbi:MAG: hypothetical protein ACLTEE_08945 [Anaerobutyricum hallii]